MLKGADAFKDRRSVISVNAECSVGSRLFGIVMKSPFDTRTSLDDTYTSHETPDVALRSTTTTS